jgi:cyclopropane-fatty-acyl-phospholipid synthase
MLNSILRGIFRRIARGQSTVLLVVLANGSTYRNHDGEPEITVMFKTARAQWRFLVLGYVGFFESYFEGEIDIAGNRAVAALIRMAYRSAYRYQANPCSWSCGNTWSGATTTGISSHA